jgi:hypothetical protein
VLELRDDDADRVATLLRKHTGGDRSVVAPSCWLTGRPAAPDSRSCCPATTQRVIDVRAAARRTGSTNGSQVRERMMEAARG